VSDVIEEKLGFKKVVFDKGAGHRYDLAGHVTDAGAEVTGRLLGMTS
jgi:hypothetical protein